LSLESWPRAEADDEASRIVDNAIPEALDSASSFVKLIRVKLAKANANWLKKFDSCVAKIWLILHTFDRHVGVKYWSSSPVLLIFLIISNQGLRCPSIQRLKQTQASWVLEQMSITTILIARFRDNGL
jgi:hypothetical protein